MITVGRLCIKTAGRDAGKKCVVIDQLDKSFVLIDGETRRRKCNISHLEPLPQTVDILPGASHDVVSTVFKSLGIELATKKSKEKEAAKPRPRLARAAQRKAQVQSAQPAETSQKRKAKPAIVKELKPLAKETKLEKTVSGQ